MKCNLTTLVGELQGIAHEAVAHLENIEILERIINDGLYLI